MVDEFRCKICGARKAANNPDQFNLIGLRMHCILRHNARGERYLALTGDDILMPQTLGKKLWNLKIRK